MTIEIFLAELAQNNPVAPVNPIEVINSGLPLPDMAAYDHQLSNLWLLLATALIFIMNLGFAFVEGGLVRAKNVTNVLFKNMFIPVIALLIFSAWGLGLLFPGSEFKGGFIGLGNLGLPSLDETGNNNLFSFWTHFLFQVMLASTSATIIVGAVAERMKFLAWILFTVFFIGFIYPTTGMWYWGDGWLKNLQPAFYDFAGASMIHMVGGFGALTAALMLGPRIGKYSEGRILPIPGHNMSLAAIGLFMLWFGWIGFNGSRIVLSEDPEMLSYVLVCTFLSAAAGCTGAFLTSYFANRTHDITMSGNGVIAGLVAISASANIMSPIEALIIGFIAGILVVFSVLMFDRMKIDDPVGAISVHLVCGIWGILSIGIFGPHASKEQFISQLIGIAAIGIWVSLLSFTFLFILRKTHGLRISQKDELEGLDLSRHGMKAYYFESENS